MNWLDLMYLEANTRKISERTARECAARFTRNRKDPDHPDYDPELIGGAK
jgi:hypothetical protein